MPGFLSFRQNKTGSEAIRAGFSIATVYELRANNFSGGAAVDGSSLGEVLALEVCSDPLSEPGGVAGFEIAELELNAAG